MAKFRAHRQKVRGTCARASDRLIIGFRWAVPARIGRLCLFPLLRLEKDVFFQSKAAVTEVSVLKALSVVQDPDLNRDIVSLGFIKNLKIQKGSVAFDVELTTPACPVKEQLKKECEENVRALPGVSSVEVKMTAQVRSSSQGGQRIAMPTVRNLIAVASGKGGVGKSTVTVNLAFALAQSGAKVGLLDADIYGPSIPLMLGLNERPDANDDQVSPLVRNGVKVMSIGFLIPDDQPVVWRGPMVHGALTQFLTQVDWGELDYLLIDMPPGTGDAQLTISQNAPLAGAIIVTTPQAVSVSDARKGLMMFQNVKVPILGIVENMAGAVFGAGGGEAFAQQMGVPFLGRLPLDAAVVESGDSGKPLVMDHPDSLVGKEFTRIAGEVAASLSILTAGSASGFKPLGLEWQ
jgi:ATP-binding protein involved in chromosome partitioning